MAGAGRGRGARGRPAARSAVMTPPTQHAAAYRPGADAGLELPGAPERQEPA